MRKFNGRCFDEGDGRGGKEVAMMLLMMDYVLEVIEIMLCIIYTFQLT